MELMLLGKIFLCMIPGGVILAILSAVYGKLRDGRLCGGCRSFIDIGLICSFMAVILALILPMGYSPLEEPRIMVVAELPNAVAIQVNNMTQLIERNDFVAKWKSGERTAKIRTLFNSFGHDFGYVIVYVDKKEN